MNTIELYELCKTTQFPWSVIANAVPNASLAAALVGFMITATAFLLNRQHTKVDGGPLYNHHAIAFFSAGVLVLGLDSYLFSSISASAPTA